MRIILKIRILNLIPIIALGLAFVSAPLPSAVVQSHAACDDTAGPGVNWQNCRKRNLIMDSFNFSGSDFTRTDLSASDLRNSNFSNAKFVKTNLVRASLSGSLAKNANFESVIASRTDFSKGDYEGSNFSKAEISRSNFSNTNLENSDMSKADFSRVNFSNANLKTVDLSFTNISRANLTGIELNENVSLKGAYMFLTKIENLDLSKLKGIAQWQINMACGNENTVLPAGLSQPDSWPCKFTAEE